MFALEWDRSGGKGEHWKRTRKNRQKVDSEAFQRRLDAWKMEQTYCGDCFLVASIPACLIWVIFKWPISLYDYSSLSIYRRNVRLIIQNATVRFVSQMFCSIFFPITCDVSGAAWIKLNSFFMFIHLVFSLLVRLF